MIPFISLFSRMLLANISAQRMTPVSSDSSFRGEVIACPSVIKEAAFYVAVAQFDPAY